MPIYITEKRNTNFFYFSVQGRIYNGGLSTGVSKFNHSSTSCFEEKTVNDKDEKWTWARLQG